MQSEPPVGLHVQYLQFISCFEKSPVKATRFR